MLTPAKSVRKASNEKFPTEVLREIFLYLEDEETINHVLSLVCRMWRMVTITVPQLWTHIWLIPNDESAPRSTFIPRLTLLRKRAGKELLHIKWNLTPVHDVRDFYARFTYCVSQATPMERWKSLDVIDGAFAPSTYHMVRSYAYKLERVGIFTEDICVRSIIDLLNISDARPRILQTNARSPFTMSYTMRRPYCRLRELHGTYVSAPALSYMPILDTFSAVELEGGWYETHYSLRVLRIRTITDYQLRRIKTPYLEELEIKFLKAEKPLMIKFPKLRKLKLTLGVFSPMYLFCVPQLENLHIDALKCPYGVSDSRLSGVLEQPKYALDPKVLKLNVKLSIPVIHCMLCKSPGVEELTILIHSKAGDIPDLIDALSQPWSSSNKKKDATFQYLCPNLRTLQINLHWSKSEPTTTPLMRHSRRDWIGWTTQLFKARSKTSLKVVTVKWKSGEKFSFGLKSSSQSQSQVE